MTWSSLAPRALLCLWLVLSPAAHAQPTDDIEQRARATFADGNRRFEADELERAVVSYRHARRLFEQAAQKAPKTRLAPLRRNIARVTFNLAEALSHLDRTSEAADAYSRFLDETEALELDAQLDRLRREARHTIGGLRVSLGWLMLSCAEADCQTCRPLRCAVLVRDAQDKVVRTLETADQPVEVHLPPGDYQAAVEHEGFSPFAGSVRVTAGQPLELKLALHRSPRPRGRTVATGAPRRPAAAPATRPGPDRPQDDRPLARISHQPLPRGKAVRSVAWTSLAVGAASVTAAAMLYTIGAVNGDAAHRRYLDARDPEVSRSQWDNVEAARQKIEIGHVLSGVGAAALVTATVLFVLDKKGGRGKVSAGASPTAGGAALSVSWTY